jgi:hypothetical protein
MLIENADKSKWPEAVSAPSLTAFTRLTGPESAMNSDRFDSVCIGSSKHFKRGVFQ